MSVPDEPRHVYLLGGAWFNRLGEGGHIGCTVAENDSDRISFGGECFLAGFVADFDSKPVSPSGLSMDKSSPVIPRGFVDWESRLRFFRARQLILGGQMCSQAPQCSATGEGLSSGCLGDADWNGIQRKLDDWGGQAFQTAWADWWNANRSTWLTGDFGFSEFKSEAFGSGDSNICTGGMDSNDGNSGLDSDESGRLQGCEGTKGKWETTPRKRGREREANTKDKVVQPKAVGSKEVPAPQAPSAKAVQTAFLAPTVLGLVSVVVPASATKSSKVVEYDDPYRKWEATHKPNVRCERGSFAHRDQEKILVPRAALGGSPFARTLAWMKYMRPLVFKTSSQSCPGWPGPNPIVPLLPSHLPSTPLCLTSSGKPLNRSWQRVQRRSAHVSAQSSAEWLVASFGTWICRSSGDLSMLKEGLGTWSITGFQELAFGTLVDDLVPICRPANASTEAGRGTPHFEILTDTMIETTEDIAGGAQSGNADAIARRFPPTEYNASVGPLNHLRRRRRFVLVRYDLQLMEQRRTELLGKDTLGYVQNSAYSGYLTACHQDTPFSQAGTNATSLGVKLITAKDFTYLTKNTGSPFTSATSAMVDGVPPAQGLTAHAEAAKKASGSKPNSRNKKKLKLTAKALLAFESLHSFDAEESKVPPEASHIAQAIKQEGPPKQPFLHSGASSSIDNWVNRDQQSRQGIEPYDAITTEDFMDRATEQTRRWQAATVADSLRFPQRSSGALTGASVKNLCLHCEVSPGTDWPFGLLCDKCHENLSGPQEASHAPQAGNILSCGEVCGIGEACRNEHGTIQGTCTHTKGHDPAVAHMCKPCIDYSSSEEDEQAWNKSLSPCRSII